MHDRIICMHGGLSPELQDFDQSPGRLVLRLWSRGFGTSCGPRRPRKHFGPVSPLFEAEVADSGLLVDLLWPGSERFSPQPGRFERSDPSPNTEHWGESERGVSFTFGASFCKAFGSKTRSLRRSGGEILPAEARLGPRTGPFRCRMARISSVGRIKWWRTYSKVDVMKGLHELRVMKLLG